MDLKVGFFMDLSHRLLRKSKPITRLFNVR